MQYWPAVLHMEFPAVQLSFIALAHVFWMHENKIMISIIERFCHGYETTNSVVILILLVKNFRIKFIITKCIYF